MRTPPWCMGQGAVVRGLDGGSLLLLPFCFFPHVDPASLPFKGASLSGHEMLCPDLGLLASSTVGNKLFFINQPVKEFFEGRAN